MSAQPTAGGHYASLISEQLEEERGRKSSLEQRGITVITSSGVFVSLVFGFSALVTSRPGFELKAWPQALLIASLIAFFAAAIAGIVLNSPRRYREASVDDLKRLIVRGFWDASDSLGGRRASQVRVSILNAARDVNAAKAKWLTGAVVTQVVAISLLSAAVVLIILE